MQAWGNIFGAPNTKSDEESTATVLIEYAVLPPVQDRFVEIFKKLQAETEKEPGVKVYTLSIPVAVTFAPAI